jgi:hypothetical protein
LLSLGKELYVINHKNVTGAIFLTELIAFCTVLFHAHLHKFTDHLLAVDIYDLCAWRFLEKIVADCVKKGVEPEKVKEIEMQTLLNVLTSL